MISNVDYHIIDRCNLNCGNCNHFSSLVPPSDKGKSIEQITADLTLLSKIKSEIKALSLLGGEPTLHPQLSKILRIARKIFPDTEIHLITNGTNYDKYIRWKDALIENNIMVYISVYPYCQDYRERLEVIHKILEPDVVCYTVDMSNFDYGFLSNKTGVATDDEIYGCNRRFNCLQLKDGKLYICHFAAQFNRLKDYFGDAIEFDMDGKEYLDLNGDITSDDVNNFIYYSRPLICDHCAQVSNYDRFRPWATTKKDINEWMIN